MGKADTRLNVEVESKQMLWYFVAQVLELVALEVALCNDVDVTTSM